MEVYAVVDGQLFLIGPAELRHLRWMMHMADKEVRACNGKETTEDDMWVANHAKC